jgi:LysM repeat protein
VGESKATTYKVQSGDTFESIARSKLGDPKRQTEIAKLNPTVKPNRMRVGQDLVLPGAKPAATATEPAIAASTKKSAAAKDATVKASDTKASDTKASDAKESTKEAGADRSYVVGKGDTFGRIAQTQLGSSKRVDEIRELNPSVDPTRLRVGQRIKLPKK